MISHELYFPSDGPDGTGAYDYFVERFPGKEIDSINPQSLAAEPYADAVGFSGKAENLNAREYAYWLALVAGVTLTFEFSSRARVPDKATDWPPGLALQVQMGADSVLRHCEPHPEPPRITRGQQ
jgi:hypothetical protein